MARKRNNQKKNYTLIENIIPQDKNLSLLARGLMIYMWSMPDNWQFTEKSLAEKNSLDSLYAIKKAIRELIQNGYLYRRQIKTNNGKFTSETIYELYENPQDNPHFMNEKDKIENNKQQTEASSIKSKKKEVEDIFDTYTALQDKDPQEYLIQNKKQFIKRIIFNLDSSVKSVRRYITTCIDNEVRKYYMMEELHHYDKSNIQQKEELTFTEEEKALAKGLWDA